MSAYANYPYYQGYQASQPQTIQQTVPGYQPTQAMPSIQGAVDWNPQANAATTPGAYVSSWDRHEPGGPMGVHSNVFGQGDGNNSYTPNMTRYPWQNPLATLNGAGLGDFGSYQMPTAQKQGFANTQDWQRTFGYQGGTNNQAYTNQFGNNSNNQGSLQGLYSNIQGLSTQNLQGLSNNFGDVEKRFGYAQQIYANDYANTDYAKQNPMTSAQTTDWLQASYNTLTKKMDDNHLL